MKTAWALGVMLMATGEAGAASRDATINAWMRDYGGDAPGASVLVLENGKPAFERSYGMAERETGRHATPATQYRLASISKQFTAVGFRNVLLRFPDRHLTVVVLTNRDGPEPYPLARRIAALWGAEP